MTNNVNNFIGKLRLIKNKVVKRYGGLIKFRGEDTIKRKIEDRDRNIHSIIIHNVDSYFYYL